MTAVFVFLLVLSGTALAADIILRFVHSIGRFGLDKKFALIKGKTIPVEQFLPDTLSKFIAFVFSFSASALIFALPGLPWYVCTLFGALTAMLVNFITVHFLFPARDRANGQALPSRHFKAGDKVVVSERIPGDGYGKIYIVYKKRGYEFPALSANETDIEKDSEALIVTEQDGVFWVETETEIYSVLEEKQ